MRSVLRTGLPPRSPLCYQTLHFVAGFIFVPGAHWKVFANSSDWLVEMNSRVVEEYSGVADQVRTPATTRAAPNDATTHTQRRRIVR